MGRQICSIHLQDNNAYNSLNLTVGIKRNVMNEESSLLLQRRLGHMPWTLLTLKHVWIALRESKLSSQKRVQQGVNICYKSYIQTFVVLIWMGVI